MWLNKCGSTGAHTSHKYCGGESDGPPPHQCPCRGERVVLRPVGVAAHPPGAGAAATLPSTTADHPPPTGTMSSLPLSPLSRWRFSLAYDTYDGSFVQHHAVSPSTFHRRRNVAVYVLLPLVLFHGQTLVIISSFVLLSTNHHRTVTATARVQVKGALG